MLDENLAGPRTKLWTFLIDVGCNPDLADLQAAAATIEICMVIEITTCVARWVQLPW